VAEIVESVKCRRDPGFVSRELGSSQGESPRVGCSKSRVTKSRGARIAVGSRSREDHWIRTSSHMSCIQRFRGWEDLVSTSEVVKC
jgi:hypothetical protein